MAASVGSFAVFYWFSEIHRRDGDGWDTVSVGARCTEVGAEERTYDRSPVYCAPLPSRDLLLWSTSPRDIPEMPASWDGEALGVPEEYRVQVRICMSQTGNGDRACHAAIVRTEDEHGIASSTPSAS